jgi:hypothetical protein
MSDERYAFADIAIEPVPAGTRLLVTGPTMGGLRDLLVHLLLRQPGEGALLVAADVSGRVALDQLSTASGASDTDSLRVIDCSADASEAHDCVRAVSGPGDLTGIGIGFSTLYEELHAAGHDRVRTGFYTLGPLITYAEDVRPVFRFLHTINGRISAAGGLGVTAVDPGAVDERTIKSIEQVFDGRIQMRETEASCEFRVRGLADQPDGWQAFEPGALAAGQ